MVTSSDLGAPHPGRHPDHEDVAAALRGWHTTSWPEVGVLVVETWFGFLSNADGERTPRVLLAIDRPEEVHAALVSAMAARGASEYNVWVTDRDRAARLDGALRSAGCEPMKATTHLTLVGELRAGAGIEGLEMVEVDAERLTEWARVKVRCFEDTEADPTSSQLERELSVRAAFRAVESLRLARLGDEAVGVLGYEGDVHRLVFNLGTRVPFRHQGIAQTMLAHLAAEGVGAGCRSLSINADDPGRPAELYRRLGFTDEVYWYRRYRLCVTEHGAHRDASVPATS
jgi:ribosomal protein S18 acetylase RimI-like enzyme